MLSIHQEQPMEIRKVSPRSHSLILSHCTFRINATSFTFTVLAKCTNDDVKMTKVMITDPEGVSTWTYELNGTTYVKNQGMRSGYGKPYEWLTGHWKSSYRPVRSMEIVLDILLPCL